MTMYYMFSPEERNNIINGKGMADHASIYADGKIQEPKYDYKTNKFVVKYHKVVKGKIQWVQTLFDNKSAATEFYLNKYREYMYEWTIMFYDDFKQRTVYSHNQGK